MFISLIVLPCASKVKEGDLSGAFFPEKSLLFVLLFFFSLTVALTRQNVNEFKFEQRQAMRFPDRLNHHQHHLTVGRQQNNIRRGAGISANPDKFLIENILMQYIFCRKPVLVFRFYDTNILKMFFLNPLFWNFPQFLS